MKKFPVLPDHRSPLRHTSVMRYAMACLLGLALQLALALPASAQAVRPALAAGSYHMLALRTDGTVWAWGDNSFGQLGDGTTTGRTLPGQVAGIAGAVAVAVGDIHSLVLLADGGLIAWGGNLDGQLGEVPMPPYTRSTPARVQGVTDVVAIAAAGSSSLALKRDGTIWSWGENYSGQLGLGDTSGRSQPTRIEGVNGVVGIAFSSDIVSGAALKGDGTVWTWGSNYYGQLGDGTLDNRSVPAQINIDQVARLSAGVAFFSAERTDGSVWTWGRNDYGQLGDGSITDRLSPAPVAELQGFRQLVGGWGYSLGLAPDGTLHAWGYNGSGQIGDGSTDAHLTPVAVNGLPADLVAITCGGGSSVAVADDGSVWTWGNNGYGLLGRHMYNEVMPDPQKISGLTAVSVAAGGKHSLAIADDGLIWAWGSNEYGQLGDGGALNHKAEPMLVAAGLHATALAACDTHSLALTATGEVYAWGSNLWGQLGDGSTSQRDTPTKILTLDRIAAIGCGDSHSVALGMDGRVWAWGNNWSGQLGNGVMSAGSPTPTALIGLADVQAIAVGGDSFTMALTADGTVHTWGSNETCQLGDGSGTRDGGGISRAEPTPVMYDATAIVAGYSHAFARREDGNWYGWGSGRFGQLDTDTINRHLTPIPMTYPATFSSLIANFSRYSAGFMLPDYGYTLGLTAAGDVWAWGNNEYGVLGNPDLNTWRPPPQQITGISGVRQVAAGKTHVLALTTAGEVWAWGDNWDGKLGLNIDFSVPQKALSADGLTPFNLGSYSANRAFDIRASVSGPEITPMIEATLSVAAEDQGRPGKIYATGLLPNGTVYFLTPNGWELFDGITVPAYTETTLGEHSIPLWSGRDTTGLAGTLVYVGYGLDESDLLDNHKYFLVHTVP